MSTEAPVAPSPTPTAPTAIPPGDKSSSPVPSIEHNSPGEIESRVQEALKAREAMADFFDTGKRKKAEPKPKETPAEDPPKDPEPEDKPAKPEKKAEEEPKEVEKKPKRKPRVEPEDEEDDVADRIEKGFEKVAKKLEKQAPKEEKPSDSNSLSKRDADKLRVFEEMAKEKSDEYGNLPSQFKAFVAKEAKYKAAWEKKNPGETFDPTADDHSEFYEQNEPVFDQDDYVDARAELKASEAFERKQKALEEKMSEREKKAQFEKTAKEAISDVGDALATALKGEKTDLKSLASEDPVQAKYVKEAQGELENLVEELFKVFTMDPNSKKFDQNDKVHSVLYKQLQSYEDQLLQMEPQETMMGQKRFTTIDRFAKMSPDQQARHWSVFVEPKLVKDYLVQDFSAMVKAKISEDEQLWEKRVSKNSGQQNGKTPAKAQDSKPATQAPAAKKTPSPSVSGGDRSATPIAPAKGAETNPLAAMANFYG
jgi:hypothetical protein